MENDEMKNKIEAVLSNPEMMQKVMGIARSLGGGASPATQKNDERQKAEPETVAANLDTSVLTGLAGLIGTSGPKKSDDPKLALLLALRPYLNSQRQERVDKLMKMLSMSEIASLIKNIL